MKKRTIAILIFENVELLDFAGPYEVFSSVDMAGSNESLTEAFTVAENADPVTCRNGLVVIPRYTLETCPEFDILLVPGGYGTRAVSKNQKMLDWIVDKDKSTELTTSVCTGSFVLAHAGLLAGRPATTYYGSIETLRRDFPDLDVRENTRWVDSGKIITSAGVSAGIDMSLHILARLFSPEVAANTARGIEYDYWT